MTKIEVLLRMIHVLVRELHNRPDISQNFRDEWLVEVDRWNHFEANGWETDDAD